MNLSRLTYAVLIYLSLILQPAVENGLSSIGLQPWLPALALVFGVECVGGSFALIGATILGLGVDCLSNGHPGHHALNSTLIAAACLGINREMIASALRQILEATFITAIWRINAFMLDSIIAGTPISLNQIDRLALTNAISNTLMVIVFLSLIRFVRFLFSRNASDSISIDNRWTMLTDKL